jgi:hypothetical protein
LNAITRALAHRAGANARQIFEISRRGNLHPRFTRIFPATMSWLPSERHEEGSALNSAESIDPKNPGFERMLGRGRVNPRRALEQK